MSCSQLMHHSIIDHLTLEQLRREIHTIFDGNIEKLTTPTPFRQLVAQVRLGVSTKQHTCFFREMLSDIDEPTLPFGLSAISRDGTEVNEAHLKLSQILNDPLRAHAQNLQVSRASICHFAWAQIIARASGRESVVFGTVLLGRLQSGNRNDNVMGPTINTLPLRIDIDDSLIETAVCNTHTRLSALLTHEHASLALAQRCSSVPAGVPLFSALINYRHNQLNGQNNASFCGISVIDSEERTNYPLIMSVEDNVDSLGLTAQVISSISADRICGYMHQTLESLADALTHKPQQPVRTLTVMPPEERELLLNTWNRTIDTSTSVRCLHELFESQVECDGQAIAVEYNGETLSYAELNVQANIT